jgi:hypothetical protein
MTRLRRLAFASPLVLVLVSASSDAWKNEVSITIQGDRRIITANGIPDHPTGQFPGRGNPNRISPQEYRFTVPAHPQAAAKNTPLGMHPFGVAVNGVAMDPGAAEWWQGDPSTGWQYEPLSGVIDLGTDDSNAHVQPNGAYHYHGQPTDLLKRLTGSKEAMVLVGWAADGFPIYNNIGHKDPKDAASPWVELKSSYQVKKGTRATSPFGAYDGSFVADYEWVDGAGDLDESNGRTAATPEHPEGEYHYVITSQFPYIPRQFKGTPDPSFLRHGPPGGPGGPGRPGGGRRGERRRKGGPGLFLPPGFPPPPLPPRGE